MTFRGTFRELLASWPGKLGVAFLLVLVIASVYALLTIPLDFGRTKWSNPAVWADNPKNAPPVWSSLFSRDSAVRHTRLSSTKPAGVAAAGSGEVRTYLMPLDFSYDKPPTFVSFALSKVAYYQSRSPLISLSMQRPDGSEVLLYRQVVRGPQPDESAPFQRFQDEPLRIALTADSSVRQSLGDFFQEHYGVTLTPARLNDSASKALFGVPDSSSPDGLRILKGQYRFHVQAIVADPRDSVGSVGMVVGGSVYGLMGTDSLGRDLAQGLLFGLPVALFIGIAASVVTTLIGASLGVISGYVGGATDMVIQRLSDIINNVPLLPLLIFLVFILGSHLYLIILILVAFSWPGLTILIRSMVLQVRSGQLIESAVAVGASRWRIMYRHVFPHTAPFVFAQMIFFAPAAILSEAALSFLGLGDPSIPTWGQILEQGFRTGAVYLGYWWWVIPPGVLIIITAVTFMFLALGMEPVVNPRLRRIR